MKAQIKVENTCFTWTSFHTFFTLISLFACVILCVILKFSPTLWLVYFCYTCALDLFIFGIAHFVSKFAKYFSKEQ